MVQAPGVEIGLTESHKSLWHRQNHHSPLVIVIESLVAGGRRLCEVVRMLTGIGQEWSHSGRTDPAATEISTISHTNQYQRLPDGPFFPALKDLSTPDGYLGLSEARSRVLAACVRLSWHRLIKASPVELRRMDKVTGSGSNESVDTYQPQLCLICKFPSLSKCGQER